MIFLLFIWIAVSLIAYSARKCATKKPHSPTRSRKYSPNFSSGVHGFMICSFATECQDQFPANSKSHGRGRLFNQVPYHTRQTGGAVDKRAGSRYAGRIQISTKETADARSDLLLNFCQNPRPGPRRMAGTGGTPGRGRPWSGEARHHATRCPASHIADQNTKEVSIDV